MLSMEIRPGETQYLTSSPSVKTQTLADVSFSLSEPQDHELSSYDGERIVCEFNGGSFVKDSIVGGRYCGFVSAHAEDGSSVEGKSADLTAVFRDAKGSIVATGVTHVSLPSDGSQTSYEIYAGSDFSYESVELYACAY